MRSPSLTWLSGLKAAELRRVAVLIGTPCSGTKDTMITGITKALSATEANGRQLHEHKSTGLMVDGSISLLSIDMGIRNLAFAHFKANIPGLSPNQAIGADDHSWQPISPVDDKGCGVFLNAWQKRDISAPASKLEVAMNLEKSSADVPADDVYFKEDLRTVSAGIKPDAKAKEKTATKESFEPSDYAVHAYRFIKDAIHRYQPSHVIIERQRFRTMGGSAVQEWSLRVGVFEGMLHAVLCCLREESSLTQLDQTLAKMEVESMTPVRVNRFWFDGLDDADPEENSVSNQRFEDLGTDSQFMRRKQTTRMQRKSSASAMKKRKIELVKELLASADKPGDARAIHCPFTTSPPVEAVVDRFLSSNHRRDSGGTTKPRSNSAMGINNQKMDDLADCLLQGLAWLKWRENRIRFAKQGLHGYDLGV